MTATPAALSFFAVPPVDRISTPCAARNRPSSSTPVLSNTDTRARRTLRSDTESPAIALWTAWADILLEGKSNRMMTMTMTHTLSSHSHSKRHKKTPRPQHA